MHRFAVLLTILFLAAPLGAGPIGGGFAREEKIGGTPWKDSRKFRAGERASVLVANKGEGSSNFHIAVFDAKGTLVVEDKNRQAAREDLVGVVWFPPRDGEYRIEIKNLEGQVSGCFVTVK